MNLTSNPSIANAFTHGGVFHCDEVFATAILDHVLPNMTLCRCEPEEGYPQTAIVYDVGNGKYDHHQRGGNGARPNHVPYSSAGLIWRDFGMRLFPESSDKRAVFDIIDHDLIQGIDAADCGVMPRVVYPTQGYTLSNVLGAFNPTWDSHENPDDAFAKAVNFAAVVLSNAIATAVSRVNARSIVEQSIASCMGPVLVLSQFVPWQYYVLNSRMSHAKDILFVVFPSNRGGYNWQCVPVKSGAYSQRKPVPEVWRGLSGQQLQTVSGVQSASFCHPAGFIGGADTLDGAISLAMLAACA